MGLWKLVYYWYTTFLSMHYICPECKNTIDTAARTILQDQVIECPMCGISLLVVEKNEGNIVVEVTDEGK